MANRLLQEKSPYLQQHAHNPVDWYPWGEEAFEKARREDRPIFLSVGYSTCHWCHVMERESFEDPGVAEVLNRYFVPVKVDREERPDVDRIYMMYVQATTGQGGWPMSVWLTPDRKPFFGGTYFPPDNRYGRPGFRSLLEHLANAWMNERARIEQSGTNVLAQLRQYSAVAPTGVVTDRGVLDSCFYALRRTFDSKLGGFGGAPKFPRPVVYNFLLRYWALTRNEEALDMVLVTLREMAKGGMYDQLGGGFHRYSVDERWFVPHFEKMLYDQAQLAISYLEAFQITRDGRFASVARDIFEYVRRDLTHAEGGIFSAEDADSAIDPAQPKVKGEGAFYIWSKAEIETILGPDEAERFSRVYGVEAGGNVAHDPHGEFIGKNILYQAQEPPADLRAAREKLLAERAKRPRPHLDDKVLTAWSAMMISAFARGAQILDDPEYLEAARRAAEFIDRRLTGNGGLLRRWREGEGAVPAFLDDYASYILALLDLYETDFDREHLRKAVTLAADALAKFEDSPDGAFFSSAEGDASLVMRIKDDYDGAEPSGNSTMSIALLRLAAMTGRDDFRRSAENAMRAFADRLQKTPHAVPQMLVAYMMSLDPGRQIILAGDRDELLAMIRSVRRHFLPNSVVMLGDDRYPAIHGAPTAYVCENFVCRLPVTDLEKFEETLG